MVKKLDAIKIYEIAEFGNTALLIVWRDQNFKDWCLGLWAWSSVSEETLKTRQEAGHQTNGILITNSSIIPQI